MGPPLYLLIFYLILGQLFLKQRKQLKSGYLIVANPGLLQVRIISSAFNYTVSFQPAPLTFKLHKRNTSLGLYHILHMIVLPRHIQSLNNVTLNARFPPSRLVSGKLGEVQRKRPFQRKRPSLYNFTSNSMPPPPQLFQIDLL